MTYPYTITLVCGLTAALALGACGEEEDTFSEVDYLIVAGDSLAASAERYKQFREASGHNVLVWMVKDVAAAGTSNSHKASKIRYLIQQVYAARDPQRPFYVLLLGDANKQVPAGNYLEPHDKTNNTSDNFYADITGDHIPDLAIGRIPASTDAEVDRTRVKIAAYESTYKVGPWNRRLNLFASSGDFGAALDNIIESLAMEIADSMSYNFEVTMTYGSQQSEFVYVPELFSDKVYDRLNEGSLVSAYIGHGLSGTLDSLKWSGKSYPILDVNKLSKLKVRNKSPIVFIIACLTGAFDDRDALAEQILRMDDAPPAVIASTEISHPYTNAVLARELGYLVTEQKSPTVGLLLQQAKYRLVHQKDDLRKLITGLGQVMLNDQAMNALNRTHLHMYALVGDPAMKFRYVAGKATLAVSSDKVKRGASLEVTASFGNLSAGKALFSLEARRKVLLSNLKEVPKDGSPDRDAVIKSNFKAANDRVAASKSVSFSGSQAKATLAVPADVPAGEFFVKVYAEDGEADSMAHKSVTVIK